MIRSLPDLVTVVLLLGFGLPVFAQNNANTTLQEIENLPVKEQVRTLADLCWQYREKNTDLALELGLRGVELAKEKGLKKELAGLYGYIGVIYQHYKNQTQDAISYYDKSLKLSLETKDSVQLGYVYNNLGDAFYQLGNVPLAKENAEKSMSIFKKLNHTRGIAYSFINLGFVSRISHEYQEALNYFQDAIDFRKTLNDSVGIASATLELGRTYFEMEEFDKALNIFKQSLKLHRQLDNKNYMAYSMHGMGDVFLHRNQNDSALVAYKNSLELSRERENTSEIISSLLSIALVYGQTGLKSEGEELLSLAKSKVQNLNNPNKTLEVYKTTADFYREINQYEKASENYQKYIAAYDSLFSELQLQAIAEVKNRFQMMEELNQINEDLEEKRSEFYYLVIISFLLVAVILVLILRNRIKARLTSKLQESNHSKDKILSIVSHDLISPFNGLIGFSEMLAESLKNGNYSEAQEYSEIIHQSSTETLELTKNLLNWARAQRNGITPSPKEFNLVQLMEDVHSAMQSQAKSKKIDISILPRQPIMIYADQNLIKTVLVNLVNNAVKFSQAEGKIELSAIQKTEEILVSVKDNGVGISQENREKLFQENGSLRTVGTNNEKGTGLGLLVCKEFIDLHEGRIWVKSELGKGSVFYFTLPKKG